MTLAEREFEAWSKPFDDRNLGTWQIAKSAFLAGRAAGLRAALTEHKRPLVAHQVADKVMQDWETTE